MTKEEYLGLLNLEVAKLPTGAMGSGTRVAATNFVQQISVLTEPEIRMIIAMRKQSLFPGAFRDWLNTLPA
jgi:hypothetical protein